MLIFKFPIPLKDTFTVPVQAGAMFLCAQEQNGQPQMWFTVDPAAPAVNRSFVLVPPGGTVTPDLLYLGTFQLAGGSIVLHLHEQVAL